MNNIAYDIFVSECDTLECKCQPPYKIIGQNCVLANCSRGNQCPSGAECITIQGGVSYCACPRGFTMLPDNSCQDINECELLSPSNNPPCAIGAECYNRVGTFECKCPPGTSGDAYQSGCSVNKVQCSKDTDCGPNEKCIQPGKCSCPPPYFVDNLDDNKCKSPCIAFSCGVNSKCSIADPPKCDCLPGFTGTGADGCIDINECLNNPCGSGAICINEIGSFHCECPPGTLIDPITSSCLGTVKQVCSTDRDCPTDLACTAEGDCVNPCDSLPCGSNAYCEPEEHAAWCRCHPGYVEGSNGECVSMCEGFLCGTGSHCIVTNEGPTCKCETGFNGNPFPGGNCITDQCSASNPCDDPLICMHGRCKERCEGIVCGVGAKCDKNTNKCVCLPFFLGEPDLLCVPRKY